MQVGHIFSSWGKILRGKIPLLSIEITRECPLHCPGCYAYGDSHLGEGAQLKDLTDLHGDELVNGILHLVDRHDPIQVSLVGGEPLIRHRELSKVLPNLSRRGTYAMVVTSAVIPIPAEWTTLPRVTIAVSGRWVTSQIMATFAGRQPLMSGFCGTFTERKSISTAPLCGRARNAERISRRISRLLERARPEVHRIWFSVYTPATRGRHPGNVAAGRPVKAGR